MMIFVFVLVRVEEIWFFQEQCFVLLQQRLVNIRAAYQVIDL